MIILEPTAKKNPSGTGEWVSDADLDPPPIQRIVVDCLQRTTLERPSRSNKGSEERVWTATPGGGRQVRLTDLSTPFARVISSVSNCFIINLFVVQSREGASLT